MLHILLKLIRLWGKYSTEKYDRKHNTYVPQYSGKWVNKGKNYQEEWEWVEDNKVVELTYYVCVFKSGKGKHSIVVTSEPSEFAVECVECSSGDVERAVRYTAAYYQALGKVDIDDSLWRKVGSP